MKELPIGVSDFKDLINGDEGTPTPNLAHLIKKKLELY